MKFTYVLTLSILTLLGCRHGSDSNVKLVGGTVAATDQFPSTVRINDKCTASRISQTGFLLAAHCFFQQPDQRIYSMVPGASTNIAKGVRSRFRSFKISSVAIHPLYLEQMETSAAKMEELSRRLMQVPDNRELADEYWSHNTVVPRPEVPDVAIMHFELDASGSEFLRSVHIAEISTATLDPNTQDLLLVGYGCTAAYGRDGGVLHYAKLKAGDYRLEDAFFIKKKDAVQGCEGDSGGPVYLDQDTPRTIVGVNSFISDSEDRWTGFTRLDANGPGDVGAFLRANQP